MRFYSAVALSLSILLSVGCSDTDVPTQPPDTRAMSVHPKPVVHYQAQAVPPGHHRFIVMLAEDADVAVAASAAEELTGGRTIHTYRRVFPGFAIAVPSAAAEQQLAQMPRVDAVVPDGDLNLIGYSQSDPGWALDRIDQHDQPLDGSFQYYFSGAGANIYVIDSGIDGSHSEFQGRHGGISGTYRWPYDPWIDCDGHGTSVAGAAAGATWGTAKGATIHSFQVFDCREEKPTAKDSDVVSAIEFIMEWGPKPGVINLSLGRKDVWYKSDPVGSAVQSATVYYSVVASAGNDNADACDYIPAREPSAITVGASTQFDSRASFSNWGPCVDLFAPGASVTTAAADGGARLVNGTSFAAPYTTGTVAQLKSYAGPVGWFAVKDAMGWSATDGRLSNIGSGSPNRLLFSPHNWVRILGPGTIIDAGIHTWTADPFGGDGNYTYLWKTSFDGFTYNSTHVTSSSYSRDIQADHPDFFLEVEVSSIGEVASNTREIAVRIGCDSRSGC